jgi:hypothetical protein
MHTGNSDHERWDNSPSVPEAPKTPSPEFKQAVRGEKIRVVLWLLVIAGLFVLGVLYRHGWRPW